MPPKKQKLQAPELRYAPAPTRQEVIRSLMNQRGDDIDVHINYVVRELIQNSLDAGSKNIWFSLSKDNKGLYHLQARDDGRGMLQSEIDRMVLTRGASHKEVNAAGGKGEGVKQYIQSSREWDVCSNGFGLHRDADMDNKYVQNPRCTYKKGFRVKFLLEPDVFKINEEEVQNRFALPMEQEFDYHIRQIVKKSRLHLMVHWESPQNNPTDDRLYIGNSWEGFSFIREFQYGYMLQNTREPLSAATSNRKVDIGQIFGNLKPPTTGFDENQVLYQFTYNLPPMLYQDYALPSLYFVLTYDTTRAYSEDRMSFSNTIARNVTNFITTVLKSFITPTNDLVSQPIMGEYSAIEHFQDMFHTHFSTYSKFVDSNEPPQAVVVPPPPLDTPDPNQSEVSNKGIKTGPVRVSVTSKFHFRVTAHRYLENDSTYLSYGRDELTVIQRRILELWLLAMGVVYMSMIEVSKISSDDLGVEILIPLTSDNPTFKAGQDKDIEGRRATSPANNHIQAWRRVNGKLTIYGINLNAKLTKWVTTVDQVESPAFLQMLLLTAIHEYAHVFVADHNEHFTSQEFDIGMAVAGLSVTLNKNYNTSLSGVHILEYMAEQSRNPGPDPGPEIGDPGLQDVGSVDSDSDVDVIDLTSEPENEPYPRRIRLNRNLG